MILRQATSADKPAISDFLRAAYGARSEFKFPQRWEWAFEQNPFLASAAPPVWIALAPDGRVIGQSAALVEPLVVAGVEVRAGWGVDFYVLPEYRGQGIGTRLQAANNQAQEVFISLSMTDTAAQIKRELGLRPLQPVGLYTRLLVHDPDSVAETLGQKLPWLPEPVRKWTAPAAARLLTRRDTPRPSQPSSRLTIHRAAGFTEAFDRLWEQISPAFSALVRRDARYLTWKYRHQPHVHYEILTALRAGDLAGYAVLRRARPPERNAGILADLFAHPEDEETVRLLIAETLAEFFSRRVTYASAASSVPAFRRLLEQAGFKLSRTITPLAHASFPLPETGWLFSRGDHDWDQYPLA